MSPSRKVPLNEAADYASVHRETIRRYISAGRLTAYRLGPRMIRVDLDELDALLRPIPSARFSGDAA